MGTLRTEAVAGCISPRFNSWIQFGASLLKVPFRGPMRIAGGVVDMGEWRKANTGVQVCPRVNMSLPVRISTVDPETDPSTGKQFFRSAEETTANLSQSGAFVRSWEPLEAGTRVVVDFDLGGGERLQIVATVAWTQREVVADSSRAIDAPGFGIQFTDASAADRARLDRHIGSVSNEGGVQKEGVPARLSGTHPPVFQP